MDEKLNGESGNNGTSIRTLIALDGKFNPTDIDGPSQKLQSCNDVKEGAGDVSFSSYLFAAEESRARRSSSRSDSGEGAFPTVNCRWVDNNKGQSMGIECQRGMAKIKNKAGDSCTDVDGGTSGTAPFKSKAGPIHGDKSYLQRSVRLDRQSSYGQRVAVVGRNAKDGELGVFDAEKYFSNMHNGEKSSPQLVARGQKYSREGSKITEPQIARGLISDNNVVAATISRQPSSAASSLGSKAVQSDSQASWNSQSGLLSNGVISLLNGPPLNQRSSTGPKIGTSKWKIACKCPCTTKKSVSTNDSLLYPTARIPSPPTSLQSSHVSSPLSSSNFDHSLRKNSNKDREFANEFLSVRAGLIQKDEQLWHTNPKMGKSHIEIRPTTKAREEEEDVISVKTQYEGFSFPILGSSSMSSVVCSHPKEKPRLSLQVVESSCCSSRDFQKQSFPTHSRSRVYSLDNSPATDSRSSFSFPRISCCSQDSFDGKELAFKKHSSPYNYHAMKFNNTHNAEDDRSDSSSDLFEIESLSTDIIPSPCTQYHMRSRTSSGRLQLKFNSFQPEMDSEASGRRSCISCRAKQEEKHFLGNVEMGRRSDGYINCRSIVKDNPRDFCRPTRTSMLLRSCKNNRALHIASAPGSPIRGDQEDLEFIS